ncbi:hypothetical protein HYV89_03915 [Candidatus Woesearchaeota archaeon]|nr:hypothetical protein [Candidatus Woesearchaeota archaeon]
MLGFLQALSRIESSKIFQDYQKKNTEAYLTNSVYIQEWQINFYSKRTKLITSFTPDSNVKKKVMDGKNQEFPVLNKNKIKVDITKAIELSRSRQEGSMIIIIQTENSIPVWNITIPTPSLKVINSKISAESGEILEKSEKNIVELR